ncbi:MAG: efflux RND transporter permease subunit [Bacteroidales bacterium]|jgi:HAE1 family hydrophobic/amphiphilic exporter-1|nr:efflux RND transporter permease subunit [Bacteroidales bacterium]
MSLYQTAVKRPITTALIFVAIAIFGIFSLMKLPIDLYPEIDMDQIMVVTYYAGASASDIENNVTKVLENGLNSVSNLKHITSQSRENVSVVTLEFNYGTDPDVATNDIRDKLDVIKSSLPDNAENPVLFKFSTDDIPILILSVTSQESEPGLYRILTDAVVNPLARINGVGAVSISGIPKRQIMVYCDPYKLSAYNLSVESIASVIGKNNRNIPSGSIDIGSNTYSLRVQQEFTDPSELKNIVISSTGGKNIYLKDVATIKDTLEERTQEAYVNNKKGGIIIIQKQSGANSVSISKQVMSKLPSLEKKLPSDVKLGVIINTSDNIVNTIDSLKETILITFLIVMLVVFIFLGRWRATFIIILTIPISLLASLIYLLASGNTLNIISLSSLSIAIGMVVDDAIVVLENITTHIERGSRPAQASVYATNEVAISIIASTLTMLAVFLPLTMVQGMTGVLFRQLGWTVSIIMLVSLISAMALVPMLCSKMLKLKHKESKFHRVVFGVINRGIESLNNGYAKLLGWAVHHRSLVLSSALVIFLASLFILGPMMKTEFFPAQDNSRVTINIKLPTGTRQDITRALSKRITNDFIRDYPEIEVCNFSEGSANSDNTFASLRDNGTNIISFNIRVVKPAKRKRNLNEICASMRKDLHKYPLIRTFSVMGGQQGGMGGQGSVEIDIYGYDFANTDAVAASVKSKLMSNKSINQVVISRDEYTPEYHVVFNREKLAMNGLDITTASTYLRNRVNGVTASEYREQGDEYDIIVRYAPQFRESLEDIENIIIYNNSGNGVRVRDVADIVENMTPPTIERKDRERVVSVTAMVPTNMALSDLIQIATDDMNSIDLPTGITWDFGGTYEDQQSTYADIITLMLLVLILVFIVMAAEFESLTYPFVIMLSIPFALVGVIMGLVINNTPLSVMSMIGLLMLLGIVVKNGIVLIDYIRLCRERGLGVAHAVVTAGRSRLRPVLMTTLTTVLGMLPLAMGRGEGSEMWRGMGLSVAWGLSISTLVTLVIVPTMYCVFAGNGIKRLRKKELK